MEIRQSIFLSGGNRVSYSLLTKILPGSASIYKFAADNKPNIQNIAPPLLFIFDLTNIDTGSLSLIAQIKKMNSSPGFLLLCLRQKAAG